MLHKVRLWDLPTRIFHWALVGCVIGLVASAEFSAIGMTWHFRFGYSMLTLLLFRFFWGFLGGTWSRFSAFIYSPAATYRYITGRGSKEPTLGHNPLGALSVFALLGFLAMQVASGLISDDEIANTGPLAQFASNALVSLGTFYHKEVGKLVLIGLVLLHVAAILFYVFKRGENLVTPMIQGDVSTPHAVKGSRDDGRSRLLALLLFAACAAAVTALVQLTNPY